MKTRLIVRAGAVLLCVVAGVLTYGNWKGSALHRYVCGSDAPYLENMMWIFHGERAIDNWPARLCGCKPPPGYAEYKAKVGFHWENGRLVYRDTGENYAAVQFALAWQRAKETKDTVPSTTKAK